MQPPPLVIAVSSRSLFNLEEENQIHLQHGLDAYVRHQVANEDTPLAPGTAFPLIRAFLTLNAHSPANQKLIEVIVLSHNTADTGLRIFNSIHAAGLDITRAAFTGGAPLAPYLKAFNADLLLSRSENDVQQAVDAGCPAAVLCPPPANLPHPDATDPAIRIAFDGDAVLFSAESEIISQRHGIDAFHENEQRLAREPLPEGPFAQLLKKLSHLQATLPDNPSPLRIALVTARSSPAHERVIRTLRAWGVRVDEAFFLGGLPKAPILRAFRAHIFFDDLETNLIHTAPHVPSARVPHLTPPDSSPSA